jgi:class 3 adenylate cyclase
MIKQLPAFANETEEANWWYDNRELHEQEFIKAMAEGRVKRGGMARRLADAEKAKTVTIEIGDALKATALAEEKGVEVNAYLANLLHVSLQKELDARQSQTSDAA